MNLYNYLHPHRNGHPPKGPLIKVTGEGELATPPDSASVNVGVITENKELIKAQHQNSSEITKVINALHTLGIAQPHIQTFDYRIESEYDYEQAKQLFRAYKVTHLLRVIIKDLSLVGKVVDTAVQNGANFVSNIQFIIENKEAVYLQALEVALQHALEKAKTIASTLNVTLNPTPILVVEDVNTSLPLYPHAEALVKGVSSTQIEPGQIKVKATLTADFHYQPKFQGT